MAPLPVAVFVAAFMLLFAGFAVCLGLGIWVVILRGMVGILCNLEDFDWRDLRDVPEAAAWVIGGGVLGALIASGGFMLGAHVVRGIMERWL